MTSSTGADLRVLHAGSDGSQQWYAGPDPGLVVPYGETVVAVGGDGRLWLSCGGGLYILEGTPSAVSPTSWARVKALTAAETPPHSAY